MEFIISRTTILYYEYENKTDSEIIEMIELPKKFKIHCEEIFMNNGDKIRFPILKIDSLQELIDLENEVGEIIIKNSIYAKDFMEIEIYDGYRE